MNRLKHRNRNGPGEVEEMPFWVMSEGVLKKVVTQSTMNPADFLEHVDLAVERYQIQQHKRKKDDEEAVRKLTHQQLASGREKMQGAMMGVPVRVWVFLCWFVWSLFLFLFSTWHMWHVILSGCRWGHTCRYSPLCGISCIFPSHFLTHIFCSSFFRTVAPVIASIIASCFKWFCVWSFFHFLSGVLCSNCYPQCFTPHVSSAFCCSFVFICFPSFVMLFCLCYQLKLKLISVPHLSPSLLLIWSSFRVQFLTVPGGAPVLNPM